MLLKGVCFQPRKFNGVKKPQESDGLGAGGGRSGGRHGAGVEKEAGK